MPIRYYPTSRIIQNQKTRGSEFLLNGNPYVGLYYITFDRKYFSGPNPSTGPNELLEPITDAYNIPGLNDLSMSSELKKKIIGVTQAKLSALAKQPTAYFPKPLQTDYDLGYINRSFVKKKNEHDYITEISPQEYTDIINGDVNYDTTMLQPYQIMWKLTGPLHSIRISQYDTKAGIIDTNRRLVEEANPIFFGIIDFIGGDYAKFAKVT